MTGKIITRGYHKIRREPERGKIRFTVKFEGPGKQQFNHSNFLSQNSGNNRDQEGGSLGGGLQLKPELVTIIAMADVAFEIARL